VRTRVNLEDAAWREGPLAAVMTPQPKCVEAQRSLASALAIMVSSGCRSLPVIGEAGRPVASISIRDILSHVADNFPQEFLNLPPDPSLETHNRYGG